MRRTTDRYVDERSREAARELLRDLAQLTPEEAAAEVDRAGVYLLRPEATMLLAALDLLRHANRP